VNSRSIEASPRAPSGEAPSGPASLAVRAARSSIWSLIGQIFQVALGLVSFALLSRWLAPADYGVLGMAATISGFLGVVGDSGITSAVTRLSEIDESAEATAFWLSIMGACVLTAIAAIAAPLLALFYKNGALTLVSLALAASFLLAAPMRVSSAKLSRSFRFRELTIIGIVSSSVAVTVAILLAARGFGVWALVAQGTIAFVLQTVMTVAVCPPRVNPRLWSRARARDLAHAGSRLSGFSLAITIGRSLDAILAGRFIGSAGLGLMSMGLKLVYQPVERLCGAIYSVFLPATVELKEVSRQGSAFQSAMRMLMIVVAPFCLGAFAIAPEIIALLPSKWAALTPVLRFYAATSLLLPVGYLSMSVLVAQGRVTALFRTSLILIPVSWAAAVIGALSRSVLGMVAAWSFAIAAGALTMLWLIWSGYGLGRGFLNAIGVPIAVGSLMAIGVRFVLDLSGFGGTRVGFLVGAIAGTMLYVGLAWLAMNADLVRAGRLVAQAISRRAVRSQT
jgi:O-antigen/teichoic acid export membrane protein